MAAPRTADEALEDLAKAATGLLFPSETDAPLLPYRFRGAGEPTPETLLAAEGRDGETPVEITEVEDFFEGLTEPRDGASSDEEDEAERWQALEDTLAETLEDTRVLRVGEVDVDAYVLGRHASGAWIGLKTRLVET
jgi:hypothetical protein